MKKKIITGCQSSEENNTYGRRNLPQMGNLTVPKEEDVLVFLS